MEAFIDAQLSPTSIEKLELNAGKHWDDFYAYHTDNFFKDRHWLSAEFPSLLTASVALEVGCGVGNTIYPLLDINPAVKVYACDFAPTAVDLVQRHEKYSTGRVSAFVADLTADDLTASVPRGTVDACTTVFCLSAISPEAMPAAIANIAQTLVPGRGRVLFRDYAAGDLAEERLGGEGKQQRIGDGFFMRGDGTRAFYFEESFLRGLFEAGGFRCDGMETLEKVVCNRRTGASLNRRFVQAEFTLAGHTPPAVFQQQLTSLLPLKDAKNSTNEVEQPKEVQVALGPMNLSLQVSTEFEASLRDTSAMVALANALLRCPRTFLGCNVAALRCGAAALPALAVLRWCRRAVATDPRFPAIESLRGNALRNGHQFAYERLRVQRSPRSLPPGWVNQAFSGQRVDAIVAAVEREEPASDGAVEEVMAFGAALVEAGQAECRGNGDDNAFFLLALPAGGGSPDRNTSVEAAERNGWETREAPQEVAAAWQVGEGIELLFFKRRRR